MPAQRRSVPPLDSALVASVRTDSSQVRWSTLGGAARSGGVSSTVPSPT